MLAACAEFFVLHHINNGTLCLFPCHGNDYALAEGKSVRLYDRGDGAVFDISESRVHIVKGLV